VKVEGIITITRNANSLLNVFACSNHNSFRQYELKDMRMMQVKTQKLKQLKGKVRRSGKLEDTTRQKLTLLLSKHK
jgi:hypothetical protein